MLKARSPKLFADFITTLCGDLEDIFKRNWAVVDKFTGDGILAFFPEFFSGPDAGFLALRAAKQANDAFSRRYREFRTSFTTILNDVGLGTGIDYGKVHQVRMAGALTIVGQPVVYACRMGGAPAGKILMNQPAFEVISSRYENLTMIDETLISIKAEGDLVAYAVRLLNKDFTPESPGWIPAVSK
jgi:class 3 adenylate cyclase